jgi:hypothetical protein
MADQSNGSRSAATSMRPACCATTGRASGQPETSATGCYANIPFVAQCKAQRLAFPEPGPLGIVNALFLVVALEKVICLVYVHSIRPVESESHGEQKRFRPSKKHQINVGDGRGILDNGRVNQPSIEIQGPVVRSDCRHPFRRNLAPIDRGNIDRSQTPQISIHPPILRERQPKRKKNCVCTTSVISTKD